MDFNPLKVIFETTQYDFTIHIFVNYFQNINFVAAMKVIFAKEYLKELYESGISSNPRKRYQPDIIRRDRKAILKLIYVSTPSELTRINSLNYERLKGNKKGLSSVRVSDKYRIEFEEFHEQDEEIITICNIIELSNHYK